VASTTDERSAVSQFVAAVRRRASWNLAAMAAIGVVTGYSISVLGEDAVALPAVGEVSGLVVGTVGLLAAAAAYTRVDCCESCGRKACGCAGDCGDRCSREA
jgi:hypothetical protein